MTLGAARVIYSINDLSMYVDQLMRGYVVAIVETERGPLWEPTPVASWDEFERLFGRCYASSDDPLVLKMGLMQGAKFIVIRIAHCEDPGNPDTTLTATTSTVTLYDRGNTPTPGIATSTTGTFVVAAPIPGSATGVEVGPFTFGEGTADAFIVKVGTGADQSFTLTGAAQTAAQVVDQINAATSDLTASVVNNKICITAIVATNNIEIKAVANDAYSVLGFVEGVYASVAGTNTLVVAVDGGGDQTFTLTAGIRTAAQIATDLVTLTGAVASSSLGKVIITSSTTGTDSSVQIKASSLALLGFDNLLHSGTAGISKATLQIDSQNPGAWGDSLKINVYDSDLLPGEAFDVRITYDLQGGLSEYYGNLSMDPQSDRYVVNYIGERSRLVAITDLNSDNPAYSNRPLVDEINGQYLTGGDDGGDVSDADYIGDEYARTGIYACDKSVANEMSIDIIIPGTTSVSVIQALTAYCERRGEFVAYSGMPSGYDPIDAKKWRMGESPYSHETFNSHRLCFEFGRPLVYDSQTDSRRYVSNLGHFASCISKTDTNYNYHYAPVGPRRGTVDFVEGLDWNLADYAGYQDMFAEFGINSLIISRQQGIEGAVFWEQYTTQRAASALRDLNVVRFLTMMRKVLVPVLKMFLFEPNHPVTWREIHRELEPAFQLWKAQYAIYDYILQTDRDAYFDGGLLKNAVLNTGLEIDQGIYHARVLVQPTRAIRYLEFEVGVLRTGEAFSSYTELKELPGWVRQ